MPELTDHALFWTSAQGCGSYEQFQALCRTLKSYDQDLPAHQLRRHLQLLGHIDVERGGKRWSASPPAWVRQPDQDIWFLAGQRSAAMLKDTRLQQDAMRQGPMRLSAAEPLAEVGYVEPEMAGCLADELLDRLLDMEMWVEDLVDYRLHHPLNSYQIAFWNTDKQKFEPCVLRQPLKRGIYQLSRPAGRYVNEYRLYHDPDRNIWQIADFTGLRFVHDFHSGVGLEVIYNPSSLELWIPPTQRWPFIYERCLVMASGCLPNLVGAPGRSEHWLHYTGIPARYMEKFTGKLLDVSITEVVGSLYA